MSIVVRVWKWRSFDQSTRRRTWREEGGDVVDVEAGVVLVGDDPEVFRQRELPLAEDRVGGGEDLLGAADGRVGDVAFAGDREEQRVDAGGIHGVDGPHPGDDARDDRPRQFVDQLAEGGVLLRRPSDRRERPDGPRAMVDAIDPEHREVVPEAVIAEVIAERTFGLATIGIDGPGEDEIGLGRHGEPAVGRDHRDPTPPSAPAKASSGSPSGKRHDGGDGHRGRPADEDVDPQRLSPADRRGVVHADPAMDLVVQADLAARLVVVARELDAVHPQVGPGQAWAVGVLGVDLRQGDERPAVHRPALDPRQLAQADLVGEDRPRPHPSRQEVQERLGDAAIPPGAAGDRAGVGLQLDQPADRVERVPEQEPRPLDRAEQVTHDREGRAAHPAEENRRPSGLINPSLDGCHLQVGIDLFIDLDELSRGLQIPDAFRQRTITHQARPPQSPRSPATTVGELSEFSR